MPFFFTLLLSPLAHAVEIECRDDHQVPRLTLRLDTKVPVYVISRRYQNDEFGRARTKIRRGVIRAIVWRNRERGTLQASEKKDDVWAKIELGGSLTGLPLAACRQTTR